MRNKPSTLYDEDLLVDVEQGQEELIDKRSKGNCISKQDQDSSAESERETNGHKLCSCIIIKKL